MVNSLQSQCLMLYRYRFQIRCSVVRNCSELFDMPVLRSGDFRPMLSMVSDYDVCVVFFRFNVEYRCVYQ